MYILIQEYLDRWRLPTADTLVYLSGNPGMIEDASARLTSEWLVHCRERFWRLRRE